MNDSIFVQIASYRDAQLIPTLLDLIGRAARPDALRIVVCRQHALNETVGEFFARGFSQWRVDASGRFKVHTLAFGGASVELIDVPCEESEGACWARNLIQQRYRNERYTLQLDSHHVFVRRWDERLIAMLESLRPFSAKPVLTAYLPGYTPDERDAVDIDAKTAPSAMHFGCFSLHGAVLFQPEHIPGWQRLECPVPARFYSGHFAFADGHFSTAVQHDPTFFFHGEEISIAVRAFTHGYDLYHPHRVIGWHEYTRQARPKIWDDHTSAARSSGIVPHAWWERDVRSHARNRALLGVDGASRDGIDFGAYDLGAERTLAQYEAYAGISFAHRGVQPALVDRAPPVPGAPAWTSEAEWKATLKRANDVHVYVHENEVMELLPALGTCHVTIQDEDRVALHTLTIDAESFKDSKLENSFYRGCSFISELERRPRHYSVEFFDHAGQSLRRIDKPID
ncbi:GlcNAc-transferase family protein [Burkholderia ubonensis]|uniref:GlcNAc-transferase family protein n=1 Tax=Burkholderia ubonensis TaxID=101571 RepID=UPI0007570A88|nr:GlcNAc-transferase family protein [Burkholderia ubonensis]KVO39582.1 hypothetical protein WJ75_08775 [Burkholderia ubonensis]